MECMKLCISEHIEYVQRPKIIGKAITKKGSFALRMSCICDVCLLLCDRPRGTRKMFSITNLKVTHTCIERERELCIHDGLETHTIATMLAAHESSKMHKCTHTSAHRICVREKDRNDG